MRFSARRNSRRRDGAADPARPSTIGKHSMTKTATKGAPKEKGGAAKAGPSGAEGLPVHETPGKTEHAYRSHNCGALRKADVGGSALLSGWVHRVRDLGGLLFIDLRDHYGITQCVIEPDSP